MKHIYFFFKPRTPLVFKKFEPKMFMSFEDSFIFSIFKIKKKETLYEKTRKSLLKQKKENTDFFLKACHLKSIEELLLICEVSKCFSRNKDSFSPNEKLFIFENLVSKSLKYFDSLDEISEASLNLMIQMADCFGKTPIEILEKDPKKYNNFDAFLFNKFCFVSSFSTSCEKSRV